MASFGFSSAPSHILPDGIATWKFKSGDDVGHYSFGELRDAKINPRSLFDKDSYGRERAYGIQVDASAKVLNTHKTTVLELLGSLGTESTHHIITAINTQDYYGTFGLTWRLVCEGELASRYLEVFADGMLLMDHASYEDWATFLPASPTPGTPNSGDLFYTRDSGAGTGRVPAAFYSVALNVAGDSEDVGKVQDTRLIVTGMGTKDQYGRSIVTRIGILCEFTMQQTSTELALMASAAADAQVGYTITLADGAVLALPTQLGFHFDHQLATDSTGIALIKVTGSGMILPSAWAGLIT